MMEKLTECLYAIGFQWKPSSLQLMTIGSRKQSCSDTVYLRLPNGNAFLPIQVVTEMEVLGTLVTA